ncbi:hypothetical protein ABSL23_16395 (plasmid) [Halobacterium sp. NMX12-1]|jgi:hypothetical protein|uniref:Uncharacterized protein n=1 Tax=Halobacterium sp. NMX12-1 TaxID=3166650 RepID=A0AAU8CGX1_9EURY
MMVVKPLDLVVGHIILNVVFKREWIRTVGCKREVDFDTGAVLGDAFEAIVNGVYNAKPANLKAKVVTHISDDGSVTIGRVDPQFPASVGLIFDTPDCIKEAEKLGSAIVVRFSQAVPPVVLLDVVNEELEAISTHIIRPLTKRDFVEFVVLGGVTRIARRGSTTTLASSG